MKVVSVSYRLYRRLLGLRRLNKLDAPDRLSAWCHEYGDIVYRFLVYRTGTLDVEDFVQETFLRAMKGMPSFRGDASPKTWLLSIARNVVIDESRKRKRTKTVTLDHLADTPFRERSTEETVEISETARWILGLLGNVNARYRDVLLLRGVYDLSPKEAGQILGWSVSKVNLTYHRAVKEARRLVGLHEGGGISNELGN